MRQLLPTWQADVDVWNVYRRDETDVPENRPWIRVNMVSSLDGSITLSNGKAGDLATAPDHYVFGLLRAQADLVLVGAETARVESYGGRTIRDQFVEARRAEGKQAAPPVAVVTRSADLDWDSDFFAKPQTRPIVVTGELGAKAAKAHADRADLIVAGDEFVDMPAALQQIYKAGYSSVLCEGGPTLNAVLMEHQMLDELCLTIVPVVGQQDRPRIIRSWPEAQPAGFDLVNLLEEDGTLLLRLKRSKVNDR